MSERQKQPTWEQRASRFLKAELKRADITYEELADRLAAQGLTETKASVANKLSRGRFSAVFFLATLVAVGQRTIVLENI